MKYKMPTHCPVCSERLSVSKLACERCSTTLEGNFAPCKFCQLPAEQLEFVEVFIKCRGSIKEVEKELGISYPTVRSRLDSVISALGFNVEKDNEQEESERKKSILQALENGEITAQEAARRLRKVES